MMYSISLELAEFLGCDATEQKTWLEIIVPVTKYIKNHNLENSFDRRTFKVDNRLQKLFKRSCVNKPFLYALLPMYLQPHILYI